MRLNPPKLMAALLVGVVLVARAVAADEPANDQYRVAAAHYGQGRWQLAADEFTAFLREHPQDSRANLTRFYLGETLVQLNRLDDARKSLAEFLAAEPESRFARQALFRKGEAALLAGDRAAAQVDLAAFHQKYPKDELDAFVLPYLADLELSADHVARAQELYEEALTRFATGPLAGECKLGLGRALETQSRFADAAKHYRELSEKRDSPLADRALFHLAGAENAAGNHEAALAALERLLKDHPQAVHAPAAALTKGWTLYKLGRSAEAVDAFKPLLDDRTLGVEAHYWLALAHKAQQQYLPAIDSLDAAAKANADDELAPAIYFQTGDCLLLAGKTTEADAAFARVLKNWSSSRWADDAQAGRVYVAIAAKDYANADKHAKSFLSQHSGSPLTSEVQLLQGTALVASGKFPAAQKALRASLAGLTDEARQAQCRSAMAICAARLGQFDEAKRAYQELQQKHAKSPLVAETANEVAEAALAAGNRAVAEELFGNLADGGKSNGESNRSSRGISGLGWSQLKANDWQASAATFDRLLRDYPDDPLAPEAALARGQALEKLAQHDGAFAMYQLVQDKYPQSQQLVPALWRAGRLHDRLDQEADAVALYRRIDEQHRDFAKLDAVLYHWAWAECDLKHAEQSTQLFERLHREYPTSRYWADATLRLAEQSFQARQYQAADDALELLIMRPGQPDNDVMQHALCLRGRVHLAQQHWDEASRSLGWLVEEYPASTLRDHARYWLAEATYRRGDYEAAVDQLALLEQDTAGRRDSWLAMLPLRRAQSLAQLNKWQTAAQVALQLKKTWPDFDQTYEADYLLGRAAAATANFAGAREHYQAVVRSPQGSKTETAAMAQWMIGETYFHQQEYPAAVREYLRVEILYSYPRWQAAALLQAGKCYELLNDRKAALELYDRLLERFGNESFAAEAKQRRASLAKSPSVRERQMPETRGARSAKRGGNSIKQ